MTTVKHLMNYLQTLPEETIVEVLVDHYDVYDCWSERVSLDLDETTGNTYFLDYRDKQYSSFEHYGKCFLQFG